MHRVDTEDSVGGMFQPGDPASGLGPTLLGHDWFNDIQENVARVIEGAGIALVKGGYDQLKTAINTLIATAKAAAIATAAGDATTKAGAAQTAAVATASGDATTKANNALAAAKAYAWSPGDMKMRAANVAEGGWYLCDGSAVSRTGDAALFAVIGTTWGAGDGVSTFNLPDLRGEHPRGADNGRGAVPDHPGHTVGTYLADQNQAHTHTLAQIGTAGSNNQPTGPATNFGQANTGSSGGAEARGRSAGVLFVIKR
ncbi:phage tail protein [Caulobacter soli]|uniref:phage tail protein n=1 Tax=Caulobacter soli TaxID=2708539 RepID=UPI00196B4468|nr:phage tail protein [Caulobacter soli]